VLRRTALHGKNPRHARLIKKWYNETG